MTLSINFIGIFTLIIIHRWFCIALINKTCFYSNSFHNLTHLYAIWWGVSISTISHIIYFPRQFHHLISLIANWTCLFHYRHVKSFLYHPSTCFLRAQGHLVIKCVCVQISLNQLNFVHKLDWWHMLNFMVSLR